MRSEERRLSRRSSEGAWADFIRMIYVYILRSVADGEHYYVGISNDLKSRLRQHNAGEVFHAARHRPWTLNNYLAFEDEQKAYAFERYPKSVSGRAFAKKHF